MHTPNGPYARAYLDDLIAGATVACTVVELDRHKRPMARCAAKGQDLAATLVSAGWATSDRVYSTDYDAQERAAIAARRGIWAGLPAETPDRVSRQDWLTGLGAFLGLLGLGGAALLNAWLTRRRDDRLRDAEARAVANLIRADMEMLIITASTAIKVMDGSDKATVARQLRYFIEGYGEGFGDIVVERGELRLLPRAVLDPVFATLDMARGLAAMITRIFGPDRPDTMPPGFDDDECARYVDHFTTARDSARAAEQVLTRFVDRGEVPDPAPDHPDPPPGDAA